MRKNKTLIFCVVILAVSVNGCALDDPTATMIPSHTATSSIAPPTQQPSSTATPIPSQTATHTLVPPTANRDPKQEAPGDFYSYIQDRTYQTYVGLPTGYDHNDPSRYPVIYLLDAGWFWDDLYNPTYDGGFENLVNLLAGQGLVPRSILVGVHINDDVSRRHKDMVIDSPLFYAFLKNELIPHIDAHYNTDPSAGRTIIGHSDGCYLVLYALFQSGKVDGPPFNHYIALSGDHNQEERQNFIDEARMWNRIGQNKQLNSNLYLAWGSDEEERFLTSNQEMTELLESRAYQAFRFKSALLEDRDHDGTIFPGIRYGLLWVFNE